MYAIAQQCLKFNTSVVAAAIVTLLLFLLMTLLIHSDDDRPQELFVVPIIDARMPEIVIDPPVILDPPEPIEEVPVEYVPPGDRNPDPGVIPTLAYFKPPVDVTPPMLDGMPMLDSSMVPLVRAVPPYPTRALQRHIEGYVEVLFTVDERGNVIEPRVIYAEPEGFFERAALQTIVKWRYAARVENGKPIPVQNVQQRIVFQIAD